MIITITSPAMRMKEIKNVFAIDMNYREDMKHIAIWIEGQAEPMKYPKSKIRYLHVNG